MKSIKRLVLCAMCAALTVVSKEVISFVPSIELVSFLLIMFALNLKRSDALFIVVIFCFIQSILYGIGEWTIMYFIIWPSLTVIVNQLKNVLNTYSKAALFSGGFGLCFGFLFSLPYFVVSLRYGWIYFLKGIPFDLIHGIGNYIIMLLLYDKVKEVMHRLALNIEK